MKIFHYLWIIIFFVAPAVSLAQSTHYKGRVVDQNGDGVENANVRCAAGIQSIESTDAAGWLDVDRFLCDNSLFVISAAGFISKSVNLNSTSDDIVLEPSPVSATVTITGTETALMDTPASVTQLEHQALQTTAAATLDDKLRQVPGFSLFRRAGSRTANPTTQGVSLRGVGASGASRALVLSDGVPLNDPFGGWIYWGRVPSESIDEVEIIRGPASDRFGTAAIGGVIAIRTFDKRNFAARLDASYGNERTPAFSFFGSGSDYPYKVSAGWERFWTDGFVPVAPEFRGPVDDVANVRRSGFTPRIKRELSGKRSVFVAGDFYREVRANGTPLQKNDTLINNLTGGADLEWQSAGMLTLRAFGGIENYHQSFSAIAADRSAESLTRLQTVPSRVLGIRGQWAGQHGRFSYYAGGEVRDIHGRSDETGFNAGTATVATSSGGREISTGLFAGATVYITDRFFLSGGVRFDNWQNLAGFSSSRSLVGPAKTNILFPDRSESRVSPRASLLYKLNGHISFAATLTSGFRQPTLNELYRSFRVGNILTLANENLRAEHASDVEAAVIGNALDARLYLRTGPFCTRIDDPVSNVTLTITPMLITRQRQNLGRTRTCGWEGDVQFRPISGLELGGGFLLVNPRVIHGSSPELDGLLVPQVPRQQYTAQARYSRDPFGTVSVQVRGSGPQFEDDQNLLPLKGYVTVDAFASHNISHSFAIYVAGENIFDTRIEAGRTPVLTLAQPRTFRIGLRMRFGDH